MVPVSDQDMIEWLKKKSQEELWALLKQGNPQNVIPYTMALTSQLNQVGSTALTWVRCYEKKSGYFRQILLINKTRVYQTIAYRGDQHC